VERRSAREGGFTIIEVVVAVFVLVMAALATFGLLSSATKNTERAKATQVALDRAQREVETLRGLSSEELALTQAPPPSSDPLDPGYRVNVASGSFALSREPRGDYQKLVVEGGEIWGDTEHVIEGGVVNPGPTPFTSGDVSGEVYRYIVWRDDERCGEECPGPQDFKQIVVAVKLDTPGNQAGERGYVEVQSDFVDPVDSSLNDPVPGENGVVTAQQFYLTDTSCAAPPPTERQEISEEHKLHNTLGTCASGLRYEETHGAPDALLLGQPPDPWPEDESLPKLYDYSNDYYLNTNPDTTKGVQILKEEETGCAFKPKEAWTHPEAQVHRWVTDPFAANFTMTGKVTIEFYTRALGDLESTGTLCVYLFDRREEEKEGEVVATDEQLTNVNGGTGYWEFTPKGNEYWPRFEWKNERMTMSFNKAPYTIPPEHRLGVALSVEPANTDPAEAIPIMYDHPKYPTRLEVDTNTPIEGG
jgi:type II secretory pathway pseudopilin PulG